ncbi:MAG TPA: hypothetical protein VNM67_16500 [Thermoanaerobaculia bacterium]|jgi:hypothetical protein|nr:hypothetical protein [Thermoanaerobaculia bacterium]
MSRNSYRGFTLALVLIVGLGMALPAAARPAERIVAVQEGLLERLWNWVEHLWSGGTQPDKGPRPATAAAGGGGCDRGILIDPNGSPCNG